MAPRRDVMDVIATPSIQPSNSSGEISTAFLLEFYRANSNSDSLGLTFSSLADQLEPESVLSSDRLFAVNDC